MYYLFWQKWPEIQFLPSRTPYETIHYPAILYPCTVCHPSKLTLHLAIACDGTRRQFCRIFSQDYYYCYYYLGTNSPAAGLAVHPGFEGSIVHSVQMVDAVHSNSFVHLHMLLKWLHGTV